MPQFPINPEGELFEALKDTLTGDHAEGRYARNVLGEGTRILDEEQSTGHLIRQSIPFQCEEITKMLSTARKNVQAIYLRNWEKSVDAQGASDLRLINEALAQAYKRARKAYDLAEKVARAAHANSKR